MIQDQGQNTPPPHDLEAERWVIGSLILDADLIDDIDGIKAADFYDPTNAGVFAEILAAQSKGIPVQLDLLKKQLGGMWAERAAEIAASVPVPSHIKHYAEIVQRTSALRQLRNVAGGIMGIVNEPQADDVSILETAETALSGIRIGSNKRLPLSMMDATMQAISNIDAIFSRGEMAGVLTGLPSFDTDIGGFFPGELIVLAARPGLGKTSLALQIAYHLAAKSKLVYFASLEMSAAELSTRLACSLSGVSSRLVRTGRLEQPDFAALNESMQSQSVANMDIHDQPGLTVAEIRRQIRKRKKHGLVLAVIDYLQLLTPEDRKVPREQQVARMTTLLKQTAREYEIPILCLCQLNRQADGEEQPQLSHLRESGAIEQDADMVLFLAPHKPTDLQRNNATLCVKKNRNGETGNLPLDWHPARTLFTCTQPIAEEWSANRDF
jgi:replicative DNA helicase